MDLNANVYAVLQLFKMLIVHFRSNLRERTQAGLMAARDRGRKGGRPKSLDPDKRLLVVSLYDEKKYTVNQICQMMEISKPTLYKYIEGKQSVKSKP